MLEQKINIMSWNVRGLNCPDRRATVHETIYASSCHIVCLHEMKMGCIDQFLACYIGGNRLRRFAQRLANGTRGGLVMLWDDSVVEVSNVRTSEFCLSANVNIRNSDSQFLITSVYGPTDSGRKNDFFAKLVALKPNAGVKWLALGDFNQIYRARDKNKRNINISWINRFRAALNLCELKEIHLQNRRFTWSNERETPTLTKIDRAFVSVDWEIEHPECLLQALSTEYSDHCPLHLTLQESMHIRRRFRFEKFWVKMDGFLEVVN